MGPCFSASQRFLWKLEGSSSFVRGLSLLCEYSQDLIAKCMMTANTLDANGGTMLLALGSFARCRVRHLFSFTHLRSRTPRRRRRTVRKAFSSLSQWVEFCQVNLEEHIPLLVLMKWCPLPLPVLEGVFGNFRLPFLWIFWLKDWFNHGFKGVN